MSYDMYFWRQSKDLQLRPEQIIECLAKDAHVDGVVMFPRVQVREIFRKAFPDVVDNDVGLDWEGSGSYFRVEFGHATEKDIHMIVVTCGYSLLKSEVTMNRIIDACKTLGCALYDPQTGQRYEQPEPKTDI